MLVYVKTSVVTKKTHGTIETFFYSS
jgi:hypothetical protein